MQPDSLPSVMPPGEAAALPEDVRVCIDSLRRAAGEGLHAVIFFGSRLLQTSPDKYSAADLFVLVDDPRKLYEGLREQGLTRRHPSLLSTLNQVLSPNALWLRHPGAEGAGCKCFIMQVDDFERAMSARARDHFCKGRLTQRVRIVFGRDGAASSRISRCIEAARRHSLSWVPSYLPKSFSVADYCLRMLEVSFASEIRPEAKDRVREVFESQKEYLLVTYHALLEQAGPEVDIAPHDDGFVQGPNAASSRRRVHFAVSRVRATLRWAKYMLTYDNWLDYIVRKIYRRTGLELTLSPSERRFPLLLLWPKFFRVLRVLQTTRSGDEKAGRGS